MIGSLYTLIVVCIGLATVVEKYRGTAYVGENIYGAWWFSALWAVLTVAALAYIVKQRLYKRLAVFVLHLAFVVILVGALTTHIFARRGTVRLRTGVPEMTYVDSDHHVQQLPFSLALKEFRIVNYPGTDAPLDYQSTIQCTMHNAQCTMHNAQCTMKGDTLKNEFRVSMNHIGNIDGYRLFQQSYDSDGQGVTLGLSYDPYGIAITYAGYLILLIGIIATLLSRKTQMRALYRKVITIALLLVSIHAGADNSQLSIINPQFVVDKDIAHRMGTIHVLYNNRICPLNTVATDFTMKMTGSDSWHGYSADEVFFSWMIYYGPWEKCLTPDPSPTGEGSGYSKDQKRAAEKRAIVEMFYSGQFTKIFPYCIDGAVSWYSPGGQVLPKAIPVKEQFFIKQSMDFLTEAIVTGQHDRAVEIIAKIKLFQRDMVGDILPSNTQTQAEIFYNTLRAQKWPVFLSLTLSLLLCVAMLFWRKPMIRSSLFTFTFLLFAYITLQLALRWWLSGHIPVSNGPETMLFMAWAVLLLTIAGGEVILGFGPLIASFCLLVAMLGGSSEITPLMPVLQSPLLSIHVMTVMCAYALFALLMLIGIYAFWAPDMERITALSQLLLYPAVFLLTVGIFLGAVWANVSWGCYWSWDPKESWALITLMVYAVPLHAASIPRFRRPRFYHLYMVVAFLTVLITYFGVNYLLGGMHSYA
ncbi:MAG: cytochrome c biogenesis protein CcsA [Prevotella sp.]|nr:cytochrome c biogenesis protein CcsA [Prevotella sp.]